VLADAATGDLTTHSVIVYINDNDSGATEFLSDTTPDYVVISTINPARGTALVFRHACPHHGALVEEGRKVILRLDMVAGVPPLAASDGDNRHDSQLEGPIDVSVGSTSASSTVSLSPKDAM
jgi:hypothetical protein